MPFNNKIIILLIFLAFSCKEEKAETGENLVSALSISQNQSDFTHQDSLVLNPDEGLVYAKAKVFSGRALSFYGNGKIATETFYENGKRNGPFRKFFKSSDLSFEAIYKDGKKDGLSRSWWSNGNLRSENNYAEGKAHGRQKQWYRSGALFKVLNLEYGKEEGKQQSWRENGKVYSNYEAKNGRIFGLKRSNLCFKLDDEEVQSLN